VILSKLREALAKRREVIPQYLFLVLERQAAMQYIARGRDVQGDGDQGCSHEKRGGPWATKSVDHVVSVYGGRSGGVEARDAGAPNGLRLSGARKGVRCSRGLGSDSVLGI
jgi:hypothetical protein